MSAYEIVLEIASWAHVMVEAETPEEAVRIASDEWETHASEAQNHVLIGVGLMSGGLVEIEPTPADPNYEEWERPEPVYSEEAE